MRSIVLCLLVFSLYSATPYQEYGLEHAYRLSLALQMDVYPCPTGQEFGFFYTQQHRSHNDLYLDIDRINERHHSKWITYKTHTLMYDHVSKTFKNHEAIFISEEAEQALCTAAIQPQISHMESGKTCVCTTLESSAVLAGITSLHDIKVNVGVRTNSPKRNDFSGILEANKDKTKFAFIESAGDSLLPTGEFLLQLKQSGAMHDDTEVAICIGAHATSGNYTVGDIFYGQGSQRIKDPWVDMDTRLAARATQAERIASEQPCDKDFLQSSEYDERFSDWLSFVNRHVIMSAVGHTYDETLFSSQTPGNIFTQQPEEKISQKITSLTHQQTPALGVDVLIGSPDKESLTDHGITHVWGAHIKVLNQLQKEDCSVRYVFAKHDNILHSAREERDLSTRILLCTGPKYLEGNITRWAENFSAGAYNQILFTETVPLQECGQGYFHVLTGKDSCASSIPQTHKATVFWRQK